MRSVIALALLMAVAGCAKSSNATSAAASASAAAMKNPASASDGATVYLTDCSSCHQTSGQGVSGAFPPLDGNAVVTGNPVAVIAIVKNGLDGPVTENNAAYSGIMPSWKGQISDDQIAAVISYIRSSWTNHAGGVSLAQVQSVK
ncbi:MAG: c-type cytochrome [Candidatus Cybelea sp.]|jgi:mono/diheme cytochrome c family protein